MTNKQFIDEVNQLRRDRPHGYDRTLEALVLWHFYGGSIAAMIDVHVAKAAAQGDDE